MFASQPPNLLVSFLLEGEDQISRSTEFPVVKILRQQNRSGSGQTWEASNWTHLEVKSQTNLEA